MVKYLAYGLNNLNGIFPEIEESFLGAWLRCMYIVGCEAAIVNQAGDQDISPPFPIYFFWLLSL